MEPRLFASDAALERLVNWSLRIFIGVPFLVSGLNQSFMGGGFEGTNAYLADTMGGTLVESFILLPGYVLPLLSILGFLGLLYKDARLGAVILIVVSALYGLGLYLIMAGTDPSSAWSDGVVRHGLIMIPLLVLYFWPGRN
jgi:uncharacterized membrane protein YphA (DoxX/SURF4 family)